jgi:hypothetical protein
LSIAIIMTPAAYHRLVEKGPVSNFFIALASMLIATAMLPLMTALCVEVYLLGRVILGIPWIASLVAGLLFVIFASLWFAFPLAMRRLRDEA